jgi:dinuclear metal center YbgI/SA1388 family protein
VLKKIATVRAGCKEKTKGIFMPAVADVVAWLDSFAPPGLAAEWDNVGLLLGDPAAQCEKILTCLTVTSEVVAEAVSTGVNLIVSHHPVLFRAAKKLTAATQDGRLLLPLLRAGIAVHSPHTAFDNCPGGINDQLCAMLGLTNVRPLRTKPSSLLKLAVFLPESDFGKVSDAVFAAGAGVIGRYDQCSYRVTGTGTFFPHEGTNPTIGQIGRREEVTEYRLEVILPSERLDAVIAAVRASHSYEEPAFEFYPLAYPKSVSRDAESSERSGEGRIGELAAPTPLGALAAKTKSALRAAGCQLVGNTSKPVTRIAVACGAAGEFLADAIKQKADAFLTGELRFHDGLAAHAAGIGVILPGHYATERPAVEVLAAKIAAAFPGITVTASKTESDPFDIITEV